MVAARYFHACAPADGIPVRRRFAYIRFRAQIQEECHMAKETVLTSEGLVKLEQELEKLRPASAERTEQHGN